MEAEHHSKCPACGEPIAPGDEIERDECRDWCHVDCVDDTPTPNKEDELWRL